MDSPASRFDFLVEMKPFLDASCNAAAIPLFTSGSASW